MTISLEPVAAVLKTPIFALRSDLVEPAVGFDRVDTSKRSKDVMTGLSTFGAYDTPLAPVKLVLITTGDRLFGMERLIERMNLGSVKYGGAERTFGGEFVIEDRLVSKRVTEYEAIVSDFVQGPKIEDINVALVYLPKGQDPRNPDHPYYRTKSILLRAGLPSQMVDESTVQNPDWRDLNLALNVFAKSGYAPWVLDEAISGVDLFIGLSSSVVGSGRGGDRIMAYVNVFDAYGRWRFYRGAGIAFPFSERLTHFERLVRDAVAGYQAESVEPPPLNSIHFHLTKHPSAQERSVLSTAVRQMSPEAAIGFIWVNPHHTLRLFDLSEDGTGEIRRATYLVQEPATVYLTTTGRNTFGQRGMGTPVPLQLTTWTEPSQEEMPLGEIAQQILSLTRLNWASSRNFCHEPITTKFAGDIAKGMAIFARDPRFALHPRLRRVPWFL